MGAIDDALPLFREAALGTSRALPRSAIATIIPGSSAASQHDVLGARRVWARHHLPAAPSRARRRIDANAPLTIGYISSFFERENWMKPVWALINAHDRDAVNLHLFSDAPASSIAHGYRPHRSDRFHDISALSNAEAAVTIEAAGVDILVDLNGYSALRRLPVLALRPAPLNVAWFNMYATSGMSCYDYLIGDDVVIEPADERFYCERIARVPGTYLTFRVDYPVPDVVPPPCLASRAITFGSFAPQYKITSAVIDAWCAILRAVPASRLVLQNRALDDADNRAFVLDAFEQRSIAAERLTLLGAAAHAAFLRNYALIDIALDTFPYNGGTTTMEALWQGVPVIAFHGDRWAARTSESLLRAADLGRFVAAGVNGYIELAIALATQAGTPTQLALLRAGMRAALYRSRACDAPRLARDMERLYRSFAATTKQSGVPAPEPGITDNLRRPPGRRASPRQPVRVDAERVPDAPSSDARRAAFQAGWDARLLPLLTPDWQSSLILAKTAGEKPATVLERLKDMLERGLVDRKIVKAVPSKPTKSGKRPRVHTARFEAHFRLPKA